MRLTQLKVSGLKAQNREIALAPLTIIEGATGSGKTTLLQAISIAMYGVEPRLGKSLDSMRPLLAESDVSISLADDSGFSVIRRLITNRKGALSCLTSVYPPKGEQTNTDASKRVEREWGQLTVFVDVAEFLDQSPDRRRAFIANLAAAAGMTATYEQLTDLVNLGVRLQSNPVRERAMDLFAGLLSCFDSTDVQAGVARALRELALQLSRATAEKTAAEKATDDLRRELLLSPSTSLTSADLQANLDSLVAELDEIQSDIGGVEQQQRDRVRTATTLTSARSELARWSSPPDDLPGVGDAQASLETVELGLASDSVRLAEEAAGVAVLLEQKRGLTAERDREQGMQNLLYGHVVSLTDIGEACALAAQEGCMYRRKVSLLDEARAKLAAHREVVPKLNAELILIASTISQRSLTLADLQRAIDAGGAFVKSSREAIHRYDVALHDRQLAEASREATVRSLQAQIELLDETLAIPVPDIDLLNVRRLSVGVRLNDLKDQMRSVAHREGMQIAKHDAEVRISHAELDVASLVALREVLGPSGLQGSITKQLLAPLEQAANASFLSHLPYGWRLTFVTKDDKGNDILDFALMKDQTPVRWNALSTGEELTAAVALVMGLLELVKPPLRVLLVDNLTLIDMKNRLPFILACHEMVKEGALDTVVIASNEPLSVEPMDGVSTIQLTE